MARIFQLDATPGTVIDPSDQFAVDHSGDISHRASQVQVMRGLLRQMHDPAITYPTGSFGAMLLAGGGGGGGGAASIDSFVSAPGPVVELGATVVNPTLSWSISPVTVNSQSLSGPLTAGVTLTTLQRSVVLAGNVVADSAWTLSVTTSSGVLSRVANLAFGHYVHYGRGAITALTAGQILALSGSRLGVNAVGDYNFSAASDPNAYFWFCYPDSWGVVTFLDNATSLPVAVFDAGTVLVNNASGHTRSFRCIRSLNALHGAMSLHVT